jgi:chromosome segregation ATPase
MTPGLSEPVQVAIWTGPIVAALGVMGTVLATWIRTKAELHALRDQVDTTVTQTSKVGNGFADDVRGGLRRLEDALHETRRDIGDLRSEARQVRDELNNEREERRDAVKRLEQAQALRQVYPPPGGPQ